LENLNNDQVEGFLFKYRHFIGDYKHIGTTRKWHRREVRIVRNRPDIYSYRDSQGFRIYPSEKDYVNNTNSRKLNVKLINATVFHYSYCRNPDLLLGKVKQFSGYYKAEHQVENDFKGYETFDFSTVADILAPYDESHPAVMQKKINNQDWVFKHNPSIVALSPRKKILHYIEMLTGWRIGEYRNYKLIKR